MRIRHVKSVGGITSALSRTIRLRKKKTANSQFSSAEAREKWFNTAVSFEEDAKALRARRSLESVDLSENIGDELAKLDVDEDTSESK